MAEPQITRFGSVTTSFSGSVDQRFLKLLQEAIDAERQVIMNGMLPDYPAYKWHAGIIKGLEDAKTLLDRATQEAMRN